MESINTEQTESKSLDDARANLAWVTYLSPFRFIVPDGEEPWQVSLDEINSNKYDHGRLCRIVDRLSTPLGSDWPMLLCYDGGLAIPRTAAFSKKEDATEFFNRVLCNLLLGGILCSAVDARDVVGGQLYEKTMVWPVGYGGSVASQMHAQLRTRVAGPLSRIQLSDPQTLSLSVFRFDRLVLKMKAVKAIPAKRMVFRVPHVRLKCVTKSFSIHNTQTVPSTAESHRNQLNRLTPADISDLTSF